MLPETGTQNQESCCLAKGCSEELLNGEYSQEKKVVNLLHWFYLFASKEKKIELQNEVDSHKFHAIKKHIIGISKYIIQVVLERKIVMLYDQVFI